jgi:hypothetical protein
MALLETLTNAEEEPHPACEGTISLSFASRLSYWLQPATAGMREFVRTFSARTFWLAVDGPAGTSKPSSNDAFQMATVTASNGRRMLPVFSSPDALRTFVGDPTARGNPINGKRVIDMVLHMNLDGAEFDRGSKGSCRIDKSVLRLAVSCLR